MNSAKYLENVFSLGRECELPESQLELRFFDFHSSVEVEERIPEEAQSLSPFSSISDNNIEENIHFVYPVFKHKRCPKARDVIVLLHGLNERSWNKYLPWAERLATDTGKLVILFPIAFHMNRAPLYWSNPRAMMPYVDERKERVGKFQSLSYLNIALSNRLSDSPFRFYSSGKQTMLNIITLVDQIKQGKHPLIQENASVDIFAYSIGGFISQMLLMADFEGRFDETKVFLFCSGSVFLEMNGASKSIMDAEAFENLKTYYNKHRMHREGVTAKSALEQSINCAFDTMISLRRKEEREAFFAKTRDRIKLLSLKKDIVIPTTSILKSIGEGLSRFSFSELDFDFNYTHQNPFPTNKPTISNLVNQSFDAVFNRAASFLTS